LPTARTVLSIGATQTLAWASSYYLPAVLAEPMSSSLGVSYASVFLAFSCALGLSAFLGPSFGRAVDHWGGHRILPMSNLIFGLGLVALGLAQQPLHLWAAWLIMGIAMACGLYESAFASLVRLFGQAARSPITGVTLIAGFASTVGWPVSAWIESEWSWREACFFWAALHLLLGLPLNARLPKDLTKPDSQSTSESGASPTAGEAPKASISQVVIVSFVFAVSAFISTALAAHWPRLLEALGLPLVTAVTLGVLIGPSQVAARILEYGFLRKTHPMVSAKLATMSHPIGAGLMLTMGPVAAPIFALMHGAGNGIMTIVKGSLPLALFGPKGYGARQGWIMMPARISAAAAPWLFGLALSQLGAKAIYITLALGALASWLLFAAAQHAPSAPSNDPPDSSRSPG
jgi:predicted MFS family arabinose efflux permease